ncbi:MAG: hypothetical protein RL383_944 [Actinomycetota bacterium]
MTFRDIDDIAEEAYHYLYPLVVMEVTKRQLRVVTTPRNDDPRNLFVHQMNTATDKWRSVARPNIDTLFSAAWVDLSVGPAMLTLPPAGDRYHMFQMLDFWTDTFAVPGSRSSGPDGITAKVIGPGWESAFETNDGEDIVLFCPTPTMWVLGRTAAHQADRPVLETSATCEHGVARVLDVDGELLAQLIDPTERLLAAKEGEEPHRRGLTVEVARKVEQVRLDERVLRVTVEGGPSADVHRARVLGAVLADMDGGVHAVGGDAHPRRHRHIRRGEADGAAALVTVDDGAADLVRAAEHAGGRVDLAPGECAADRGAAHGLVHAVGARHETDRVGGEPVALPHLAQQCDVALTHVAEMEIRPHDHGLCGESVHENALHELRCSLVRLVLVERDHDDGVNTRPREEVELVLERGEKFRRLFRTHHRHRVTVECDHDTAGTRACRTLTHLGDHRSVPHMDTVVHPD